MIDMDLFWGFQGWDRISFQVWLIRSADWIMCLSQYFRSQIGQSQQFRSRSFSRNPHPNHFHLRFPPNHSRLSYSKVTKRKDPPESLFHDSSEIQNLGVIAFDFLCIRIKIHEPSWGLIWVPWQVEEHKQAGTAFWQIMPFNFNTLNLNYYPRFDFADFVMKNKYMHSIKLKFTHLLTLFF